MVIYPILVINDNTSLPCFRKQVLDKIKHLCKRDRQRAIPVNVVEHIADCVYERKGLPGQYSVTIYRNYLKNAVFKDDSKVRTVNFPEYTNDGDVCRVTEYELIVSTIMPNNNWRETFWAYEAHVRYRKCRGVCARD